MIFENSFSMKFLFTKCILFLEGKGSSVIKQEQLEMVVGNILTSEV